MDIREALTRSIAKFNEAGIASAALDARLLLSHIIDKPIEYLLLNPAVKLTAIEQERFSNVVEERYALKPIAYILGYREFYGRAFKLNDKILIPRPDTETLIDAALFEIQKNNLRILELGCGSGCIIISLLLELPGATGLSCDINSDAVNITKENAELHNVSDRLEIVESDWFNNIKDQKFDLIVCNPPYISDHELPLMSRETILFEPHLALFANDKGLAAYKIIARDAAKFLHNSGELMLEIGFNQMEAVKEIFSACGFIFKKNYNDLNNHSRVICFTLGTINR